MDYLAHHAQLSADYHTAKARRLEFKRSIYGDMDAREQAHYEGLMRTELALATDLRVFQEKRSTLVRQIAGALQRPFVPSLLPRKTWTATATLAVPKAELQRLNAYELWEAYAAGIVQQTMQQGYLTFVRIVAVLEEERPHTTHYKLYML